MFSDEHFSKNSFETRRKALWLDFWDIWRQDLVPKVKNGEICNMERPNSRIFVQTIQIHSTYIFPLQQSQNFFSNLSIRIFYLHISTLKLKSFKHLKPTYHKINDRYSILSLNQKWTHINSINQLCFPQKGQKAYSFLLQKNIKSEKYNTLYINRNGKWNFPKLLLHAIVKFIYFIFIIW